MESQTVTAQVEPTLLPPPITMDQIPFGEIGFVAIASLWMLQYVLKSSDRQSTSGWSMLQRLVEQQQKANDTLARTNQELIHRLARVHERLERIERALLDKKCD